MSVLRTDKMKKAQATILGLLMVFIMVIVFSVLYEPLAETIEIVTNDSGDSTLNSIMDFIPIALAITILVTIFIFVTPQRAQ